MALLHLEGFEWLSSITRDNLTTEMDRWWSWSDTGTGASDAMQTSRTGYVGLALTAISQDWTFRKHRQPDDADNTLVIGMFIKTPTVLSSFTEILRAYAGESVQFSFQSNSDGTLDFYRGTGSLLGTSTFAFSANTKYYVEFKVVVGDGTNGSMEMWVADLSSDDDTVTAQEWTITSVDTRSSTSAYETSWDAVQLFSWGATTIYDDIYICDGTGSTNNDLLGNLYVEAITPTGAGTTTDFTPSAGSNYQNVDETGLSDDDTTYNEATANGDIDLYSMSNLPGGGDIFGVQVQAEVRVTEGDMRKVKLLAREGTTTGASGQFSTLNDTYGGRAYVFETNPDTSLAWTSTEVDAIECGIEQDA